MLARYLNSGGKVQWHDHTDAKVSATFTHPAGGELTIDWDMERAKKAGLGGKDMWAKYPRQMLRARVISEGIRATNPAVASGIYTPEEVHDMDETKPARRGRAPSPTQRPPSPAERDITAESEVLKVAPEQIEAIHTALSETGVELADLLAFAEITDIGELAATDGPKAVTWIKKQKPKKAA
jgi:hypothetical protein